MLAYMIENPHDTKSDHCQPVCVFNNNKQQIFRSNSSDHEPNYFFEQFLQPPNTMPPPSLFASPPRSDNAPSTKSAKKQLEEAAAVANIPGMEESGGDDEDGGDIFGDDKADTKAEIIGGHHPKSYFSLLRDRFRTHPDFKVSSILHHYRKLHWAQKQKKTN